MPSCGQLVQDLSLKLGAGVAVFQRDQRIRIE